MPLAAFPKCFLDALCVTRAMSVFDWIELSASFDIDGLEFYYGFTPRNSSDIERVRAAVEKQGRSIPMLCFSPDFTKPTLAERHEEIARQKDAIQAAADLGAKFCRTLSGQRRPNVPRDEGLRWVRECILECLPFAEQRGITLVIENHYKDGYWDFPEFAQKADDFLELVASIPDSPSFGVNYDPSNAILAGDDPIQLLETIKHRVRTMHASDRYFEGGNLEDLKHIEAHPHAGYANILKHGVIGRGLNDYDRIFSILKASGFTGWISIEDGPDPATGPSDIAESATFLRKKMAAHGLP